MAVVLQTARSAGRDRVDIANPIPVSTVGIADGATAVVDHTTAANAACVATIATGAAETAYLSKAIISGLGATGAAAVDVTIAGAQGEDIVFPIQIPAGATTAFTPIQLDFNPPLRGAVGDDITVTCAAAGAGNTRIDVIAIGWKA